MLRGGLTQSCWRRAIVRKTKKIRAIDSDQEVSLRSGTLQGRAIPARCHAYNATENFCELTLVREAATHGSLKNSNAGLAEQLPGIFNSSPQDILIRRDV